MSEKLTTYVDYISDSQPTVASGDAAVAYNTLIGKYDYTRNEAHDVPDLDNKVAVNTLLESKLKRGECWDSDLRKELIDAVKVRAQELKDNVPELADVDIKRIQVEVIAKCTTQTTGPELLWAIQNYRIWYKNELIRHQDYVAKPKPHIDDTEFDW